MDLTTNSVWDRRELTGVEISPTAYNLTIGLVLCWGFFVNYLMVQNIPAEPVLAINQWVFLIGYIACIFGGTWICSSSNNPVISFAGYNLIVVPLGLVLVRFLYFFDAEVISQAFLATGLVTGSMMMLSMMYPAFFLSIGRGLFVAFIVAFIVEIGIAVFTGASPPIFDWIFVMIFSGYIGYDWARAQKLPKTLDNAVDSAAALYVDIVILFIRLVRIFGRR
jgi:FtsH-binding integral membrane protein